MCGRFTLRSSVKEIAEALEAVSDKINEDKARYNIAPTQTIVAARESADVRELVQLKWGLVPAWAKDPSIGSRLINARSETVAEKPSFKEALRLRRCLIPASGFYEWKRTETGNKQPFYFKMRDEQPFAFAGLWERWGEGRDTVESCTILTTEANELLAPVHDRMPVIVAPKDYGLWLDQKMNKADQLTPLLRPYPAKEMTSHPVSSSVNNPRYDHEDMLAPAINSQ
jgi:putative SOS response-associated peptidase YedK